MNNKAFIVGSIFGGIIATIVVGNVLSHNRNIEAKTTDSEPKTDDTVSYSDAVNAIVSNAQMLSSSKQELIEAISIDMDADIYEAIVCVAQDNCTLNKIKHDTILQICKQFREKNKPYNERM